MDISHLVKRIKNALEGKAHGKSLSPKEKCMLLLLFGLLLAVIVFPVRKTEDKAAGSGKDNMNLTQIFEASDTVEQGTLNVEIKSLQQYEVSLSKELEDILSEIDGVGKVEAWVTVASGNEKILYQEKNREINELQEEDHAGGTRNESKEKVEQKVLLGNDGNPYVIKTLQPEVVGVLVVAEGAGDGNIKKNITEAVQVLFGIEAHRIKVAKKKVEE